MSEAVILSIFGVCIAIISGMAGLVIKGLFDRVKKLEERMDNVCENRLADIDSKLKLILDRDEREYGRR